MYHDSHAHLQLGNNSDEKLKNYENMYRKNLIGQMICNSTSENDFKEIEILSNQFKNLAHEIFEEKGRLFTEKNKESLPSI